MADTGFMWECDCGSIEYGEFPPEECSKCWKINSFMRVPEELVAEKEKEILADIENGDDSEEEEDE